MNIKEILGSEYISRWRFFNFDTLFPLNWDALLENCCPLCGCKLRISKKGMAYCRSLKHKRRFILTPEQFGSISRARLEKQSTVK